MVHSETFDYSAVALAAAALFLAYLVGVSPAKMLGNYLGNWIRCLFFCVEYQLRQPQHLKMVWVELVALLE